MKVQNFEYKKMLFTSRTFPGESCSWNATEYGTIQAVYSVSIKMNQVHADLKDDVWDKI